MLTPAILFNRPFPSCPKPLFQSEAKCETIDMKNIYSHANKTDFHRKCGALSLFLAYYLLFAPIFVDFLPLAPIDYPLGLRDRPKARSLVTNESHKLRVSSKNLASYIRKTDWFDFYVR